MSLRVLHQKRGRRKRRRRRREGGKWLSAEWPVFYNSGERRITLVALLNRWFASTCGKNQPLPCVRGLKGHTVKGWSAIKRSAIIEFRTEKNVQLQFNCTLDSVVDSFLSPCFSAFFFLFPPPIPTFFPFFLSSMREFSFETGFWAIAVIAFQGVGRNGRWEKDLFGKYLFKNTFEEISNVAIIPKYVLLLLLFWYRSVGDTFCKSDSKVKFERIKWNFQGLTCGHILHWYFLGGWECGPPRWGFRCEGWDGFTVKGWGTTSRLAGGLPLLDPPAPRYCSSPEIKKK